jgi:protein-disulfide isomerase
MSSRKFAGQIQANVDEAIRRGVGGTPTFFIGTIRVNQPIPYDAFKKHVDQALAEARANTKTK